MNKQKTEQPRLSMKLLDERRKELEAKVDALKDIMDDYIAEFDAHKAVEAETPEPEAEADLAEIREGLATEKKIMPKDIDAILAAVDSRFGTLGSDTLDARLLSIERRLRA